MRFCDAKRKTCKKEDLRYNPAPRFHKSYLDIRTPVQPVEIHPFLDQIVKCGNVSVEWLSRHFFTVLLAVIVLGHIPWVLCCPPWLFASYCNWSPLPNFYCLYCHNCWYHFPDKGFYVAFLPWKTQCELFFLFCEPSNSAEVTHLYPDWRVLG